MNNIDEPVFENESSGSSVEKNRDQNLPDRIRNLVASQKYCVLCTQGQRQPYGSLVAYAFDKDLKQYYFTTMRATRKYQLLTECPRIALLVDSRCQHLDDMTKVDAVTITGKATHITSGEYHEEGTRLLVERHPQLRAFIHSETSALIRIDVVRYFHVTRFQEVSQWIP